MNKLIAAAVALGLFGVMAFTSWNTEPWQTGGAGADDLDALVTSIFTPEGHVFALETLGILLTAAMIGALVIARPMGSVDDDKHYARVDQDVIEENQAISEIDAVFTAPGPLVLDAETLQEEE